MALSLGIRAGSEIQVGENVVKVKSLVSPNLIVISVDGGPEIVVSDQSSTLILPEVHVFSGVGSCGNRLAFDAPRHIPIFRKKVE